MFRKKVILPVIDPKKGVIIIKTDDLGIDSSLKDITVTFSGKNTEKILEVARIGLYIGGSILAYLGYISLA